MLLQSVTLQSSVQALFKSVLDLENMADKLHEVQNDGKLKKHNADFVYAKKIKNSLCIRGIKFLNVSFTDHDCIRNIQKIYKCICKRVCLFLNFILLILLYK